jgi:hypothetical protein
MLISVDDRTELMMQALSAITDNELVWKQPKFLADYFGLYQGEDLFAELYWRKMLSDQAIGRVDDRWWTFDRRGWFRSLVTASVARSDQLVASCNLDWMKKSRLSLANQRSFEWYRTKTFSSAYVVVETRGNFWFEIEHGFHWFKQQAWITLHCPASDPDLPLLLCLAMYLLYCINNDMAGAVAATTAATMG